MENEELKPTIIFTTFWDAAALSERLNPKTKSILSIALSNPPSWNAVQRLDFFCPSWEILKKYKEDEDWEDYTEKFRKLMKSNAKEVREWLGSLVAGNVYILCCWENTSKGANCHRRILYEALRKSKFAKDFKFAYRHGNESAKKK